VIIIDSTTEIKINILINYNLIVVADIVLEERKNLNKKLTALYLTLIIC
jgi:hypothetical protein